MIISFAQRKIESIPTPFCQPSLPSAIPSKETQVEDEACSSGSEEFSSTFEIAGSLELPLPDEILSLIMDRLEPRDLAVVAAVSRTLREVGLISTSNQHLASFFWS